MILRLRFLKWTVLSVTFDPGPVEYAAEEEEAPIFSGGASHDFERDMDPPDPSGEEPWVDRFGFH